MAGSHHICEGKFSDQVALKSPKIITPSFRFTHHDFGTYLYCDHRNVGRLFCAPLDPDLDQEAKNRQTLLRRRLTFLLIAFSLVTTVIGGAMNTMPFIYALVPASGLLIYIASVRRHVISEQLQKRRVQQLNRQNSGVSNTNLAEVVQPKPSTEHWIPLSERELKGVVILPQGTAAVRNAWEPTEVPVPTYVNAPKAVVPKRVIDLTIPGQWSEEQERLEREALAAASPSRDEIFDQQLADEAVERLHQARAANE
ncbi:MAG: hypothetical protein RLZZ334_789 [Actinomycetota bacterium]